MAELIRTGPGPSRASNGPFRPVPVPGIALVLLLLALSTSALSQPAQSSALSANLPSAPLPQTIEPPSPANISGVVTDKDGAVYQGVRITLTETGFSASVAPITITSDSNGRFSFASVPPGPFKLTVSSEGFATQEISGVLHSGENYKTPTIVLPFATAMTEVRVTASRVEIAEAELKEEEQQRVFGVIPNFYVVYAPNAPPLSTKQKFHLAWRSSIDPVSFLAAGFFAGVEQADNGFSGYGQGAQGYAKRYGANFADNFISTMIGGAILPSLLKQDPRYFYKGTGTTRSRVLYAIANAVVCKGDNGHWQPNYSGIAGSLASAGISNLYYPASDREGATLTIEETLLGFASSAAQNLFQEFLVRKLTPKLPNYSSSKP
jgi:hypothetical protein